MQFGPLSNLALSSAAALLPARLTGITHNSHRLVHLKCFIVLTFCIALLSFWKACSCSSVHSHYFSLHSSGRKVALG